MFDAHDYDDQLVAMNMITKVKRDAGKEQRATRTVVRHMGAFCVMLFVDDSCDLWTGSGTQGGCGEESGDS